MTTAIDTTSAPETATDEVDLRIAACGLVRKRFAGRAALEREIATAQRRAYFLGLEPQVMCALESALCRLEAKLGLRDPLPPTAADLLAAHIREHGPIGCVRVSSAQARGRAKQYSYWGAVRYEIRLTADGRLTFAAMERASSDRRSWRMAEQDAEKIAEREGRLVLQGFGGTGSECRHVLAWVAGSSAVEVAA